MSRVQVPEIVKQLLLLPGVRQHGSISKMGSPQLDAGVKSPFPESYVLEFDTHPEIRGSF